MSGVGQTRRTGRTVALHPLIVDAIEYYGAELRVMLDVGISVRYSAVLAIPRGKVFTASSARVADAIESLGAIMMEEGDQ